MYNRISIIYKDSISDSYFAESFSERGVALVNKCGENTFFQKGFSPHIFLTNLKLLQRCLCSHYKNKDFFPVFSLSIPFEKARKFRALTGQYLREKQYRDLWVDVYL